MLIGHCQALTEPYSFLLLLVFFKADHELTIIFSYEIQANLKHAYWRVYPQTSDIYNYTYFIIVPSEVYIRNINLTT